MVQTCYRCKVEKPKTTEYFEKQNGKYFSWCRDCKRQYGNQFYHKNKERINEKRREERRKLNPKEVIPEGFKRCSCCKELKEATNVFFAKNSRTKDGFSFRCKECRNREEYHKKTEEVKQKRKEYYGANKEKVIAHTKKYKERHPEWYKKQNRKYYLENKEKIVATSKKNHYKRISEDVSFKILQRCRTRLYNAVKGHVKSKRTKELLGCSVEHLMNHLEAQFKEGMTWDNYGEWHIDHIKPCAMFDFSKEEHQKACFHYTNLQPLWAVENIRKSDKYEEHSK